MGRGCRTYIGEKRKAAHRLLMGRLREGDHLKDTGRDGRIILKKIFKKWNREALTGSGSV
jgi:hypothetical protein